MLDPDAVAARTFGTSFRGYDPEEVRRFLVEVAAELRALAHGALEDIDDEQASMLLGEEAGRVLAAARASAAAVEAKGAERAAELQREAQEEALRLRASIEAERDRAYADGAARAEAALVEAEAEATRLVAEAEAARERVLRDLARRRKSLRTQVEQLHAARQKLLESLGDVGRQVEEARGGLLVSLPEARVAADRAARQADDEPETSVEQLESELEAFRLVGLPLAPEPEPVADAEADAEVPVEPEPESEIVAGRRSSSVRVFRVEEPPAPVEPEPEPEPEPVAVAVEPEPEPEPEPELVTVGAAAENERLDVGAVDALFARLRSAPTDEGADVARIEPPEPPRSPLLARRDAALAEPTAALLRRAKRLLADEQNAVLDALRRQGVDRGAVASDLEKRWASAAVPELTTAAVAGVAFLDGDATKAPALGDVAGELAAAVAGPLADRLVAAVERADGDLELAADGVRSVCREWRSRRLADAVEHAVRAAFGRGALAAAEGRGVGLCWVVDDGGTPCPDAEDNALAGVVAPGDTFPTGHRHPPAHPGCRCILAIAP